jgi:hypothetical protein
VAEGRGLEDGEWANARGRAGNWTGRRRKIRKAAPDSQPPGEEQNDQDDENDSADPDSPIGPIRVITTTTSKQQKQD